MLKTYVLKKIICFFMTLKKGHIKQHLFKMLESKTILIPPDLYYKGEL